MGLNPSWRSAIVEFLIANTWAEGSNSTTILAAREGFKKRTDDLDGVTTDSGSYFNEVRK